MKYCLTGISYKTNDKGSKIILCLRDEALRRKIVSVPFTPYFFYPERDREAFWDLIELSDLKDYILKEERGFISSDGKKLIKVSVKYPFVISQIRSFQTKYRKLRKKNIHFYEANILFTNRFLIDKGIYSGVDDDLRPVEVESRHRIMYLDIETEGEEIWEDNTYKYPIIVIGFYDTFTSSYHSIYIGEEFTIEENVLKTDPKTVYLYPCKNEDDLFKKFKELWYKYSPDVVVSFSPFDMDYIIKRMKKKGYDISFLSPIGLIRSKGKIRIEALDILDYAELYRKVFNEPVWNTLDYISKKELGYGKIVLEGKVFEVWKKDPKKVVEYNLRDVELLKDLEDKLGLIRDYVITIWKLTGLPFSKCLIKNAIGDILYLRHSKGKFVWRSYSLAKPSSYSGALVYAKVGIYSNVGVFDWNELYPSIMETFHISWDNLVEFGGDIIVAPGIQFVKSSPGQSNELLIPLRLERRKIKLKIKETSDPEEKRRFKMLSNAFKQIINSIYGLYGFKTRKGFGSRVYEVRVASAITLLGRKIFEEVLRFVPSIGYEIVYGDTDSVFIQLKRGDQEECEYLRKAIEDHIASYIENTWHVESKLKLGLEYIFKRLIVLSKKRYYGITTSGETVVKGLEIVRKDTSPLTVKVELEAAKILIEGGTVQDLVKYREEMMNKVKRGSIDLMELAVKGRCTKEVYSTLTRNFKAIKFYEIVTGKKIRPGERFYWVYLKPTKRLTLEVKGRKVLVNMDVIAFKDPNDIPSDLVIDYNRMAKYTVYSPLENYLEAVRSKPFKQTTLQSYW
ncbi:MAG: hypothetical protein DRI61_07325 [Chloroflexi bacterium]|nr:MAG: hypothetical protein DRI61_07325 [Chloroflexota bacterium]